MSRTDLYRRHLEVLHRDLADALERAGRKGLQLDGVLFHAGRPTTYHADDREVIFYSTPHMRRWAPPLTGPDHVVLARPGKKPRVVRVRPQDFWFEIAPPPPSYWEEAVELSEVDRFEQVAGALGPLGKVAYVGSTPAAAAQLGIPPELVEPAALMAPLDWHRAAKTDLEAELLLAAAEMAGNGHQRVKAAFEAGASEREMHWEFLRASNQIERDVPYETIVCLDEKASILHYQNKRGPEAAPGKVLLLDAGAAYEGYAADVTRTWARPQADPVFHQLVNGMDALERSLVAMVTPGRPFLEIHLAANRGIAQLLAEGGIVNCSAEQALEAGVTRTFMPHGVGHHLGLQVHDVGGHQATPDGGKLAPPAEHPMLRNTRTLEPGHVVTIEPGLYFIPVLLEPFKATPAGKLVDWAVVERLIPMGGIRIEDNILCTAGEPRDLTRAFIPGPRGT